MSSKILCFIGGGNMAQALIGGQIRAGRAPDSIVVLDPGEVQRARLQAEYRVRTLAGADAVGHGDVGLAAAATVVWAVKPQVFRDAAAACAPHVADALQISVMAGIPSSAIARAIGTEHVVRTMPNTPALIGQGVAGLYARDAVTLAERQEVEALLASTGQLVWLEQEEHLDAVTALSGSGPAYVFYFIEAMIQAAEDMGLTAEQGRQFALATFAGATALAQSSSDAPAVLRQRVTSQGGTTHAAISAMEAAGLGPAFVAAMRAAQRRAAEMGQAFGAG